MGTLASNVLWARCACQRLTNAESTNKCWWWDVLYWLWIINAQEGDWLSGLKTAISALQKEKLDVLKPVLIWYDNRNVMCCYSNSVPVTISDTQTFQTSCVWAQTYNPPPPPSPDNHPTFIYFNIWVWNSSFDKSFTYKLRLQKSQNTISNKGHLYKDLLYIPVTFFSFALTLTVFMILNSRKGRDESCLQSTHLSVTKYSHLVQTGQSEPQEGGWKKGKKRRKDRKRKENSL